MARALVVDPLEQMLERLVLSRLEALQLLWLELLEALILARALVVDPLEALILARALVVDPLEQMWERLMSLPRQRLFLREIWGISAQIRLPIWDQMISRVSSLIKCVSSPLMR